MKENLVLWIILISLIISSVLDIYLGLTRADRERSLRTHYDEWDVVKGVIWLVVSVVILML